MRPRGQSTAHAETVSRRLELLSAELTGLRGPTGDPHLAVSDDGSDGADHGADDGHTHLRELRPVREPTTRAEPASPDPASGVSPDRTSPDLVVPATPVPGRHAARRTTRPWVDVSAFRGRVALTAGQVAALAVLVAVGLAVTAWWVIRDDAGAPVAAPVGGPALATPVGEVARQSGAATTSAAATELVVDVTGKVRRPGIVVLPPGSRVVDALKAAGGPQRGADLTALNRARLVIDGEQIVVGLPAPPGVAATTAPSPGGTSGALVNLNTASSTELEELPGVGPVTAEAILSWRESNGGFRSVDQLLEVDGIGEKTLAQLTPHVTL